VPKLPSAYFDVPDATVGVEMGALERA